MLELLYKLPNMWKKNISFFFIFAALLIGEGAYITSIEGTDTTPWYQCINYFYVALLAFLPIAMLIYVIFKRVYMPKAQKGTQGITFYIINANEKQYESIIKKFISQFAQALSKETQEYSVVLIDEYHSQKYYSLLCKTAINGEGQKQAKILTRRRCCIAILIDCLNGGDGEELFCQMRTTVGVAHKFLPPEVETLMVKDISVAFAPLREVNIMKLTETSDLSQHSTSMEVICKYILASTCFYCGNFAGALNLLNAIAGSVSVKKELPEAVISIRNVLGDRIAVCHRAQAVFEYQMYCIDRQRAHLARALDSINNIHCKRIFEKETKILEGICSFVLDGNIQYAIQCMDAVYKNDVLAKYNKMFLMLYKECTVNNVGRIYNLYKSFGTLHEAAQVQIEEFTYYEYKKNETKKQLLLILFFIYDYQKNVVLAKQCLDAFCEAFPWINTSEFAMLFKDFKTKYKDVKYEQGEQYSI